MIGERVTDAEKVAGVGVKVPDAVRDLMEEIRLRSQLGDGEFIADVFVDPSIATYFQLSSEPRGNRYRGPRRGGDSKRPGLWNALIRKAQATADIRISNVPTGSIKRAIIGEVFMGHEIGFGSSTTPFIEVIELGPVSNGGGQIRKDHYLPANAITGFAPHEAPQK